MHAQLLISLYVAVAACLPQETYLMLNYQHNMMPVCLGLGWRHNGAVRQGQWNNVGFCKITKRDRLYWDARWARGVEQRRWHSIN